jgi:hypothetical protein
MNEESPKLILLADIIEQKVRKERELEFYEKELVKLQEKMYWIRREIDLNTTIIDIIKRDNVIDFKENMEKRLIDDK